MNRWEIQRSKCSAECGVGVQQLSYTCIQTFPQMNHRQVVDDSHCPPSQKNKLHEKCMGSCASATWTYEEFGPVRNFVDNFDSEYLTDIQECVCVCFFFLHLFHN